MSLDDHAVQSQSTAVSNAETVYQHLWDLTPVGFHDFVETLPTATFLEHDQD